MAYLSRNGTANIAKFANPVPPKAVVRNITAFVDFQAFAYSLRGWAANYQSLA
jgi:hypothetical protein